MSATAAKRKMQKNIVIIGNGIAGITAARHIRKNSDHRIQIISAESPYFFSRTALMYVYMGHMRFQDIQPYENHFWSKNNLELIQDWVEEINPNQNRIELKNGGSLHYDELIIATGSKPNVPAWANMNLTNVQGLYTKQDLESLEALSSQLRKAVVVGGGLIGIELVEMLLSRKIEVDFVVREPSFWSNVLPLQNADFVVQHLKHHKGLNIHFSDEVVEVFQNENRANGVRLNSGQQLSCDFLGLCIGVSPNIDFIRSTDISINKGILVNQLLKTSIENIYAIGDCAEVQTPQMNRRPIEAVWYTGRMMGETVAQTICGKPTNYDPGIWFNSAKFFDLEYQTYGHVFSTLGENELNFDWSDNNHMLTFRFDKNTFELKGLNSFGIRIRHEVLNNWLHRKTSILEVLSNFSAANFDPEFYKRYEPEIIAKFNSDFQQNVQLAAPTWWRKILSKA